MILRTARMTAPFLLSFYVAGPSVAWASPSRENVTTNLYERAPLPNGEMRESSVGPVWGPGKKGWFHNNSPWMLFGKAGTLGVGPELAYKQRHSHWGVRMDFDTYGVSVDRVFSSGYNFHLKDFFIADKVDGRMHSVYGGRAKLMNGSIYGDWYPWRNSAFRLTGGLVFNKNRISAIGNVSATATAYRQLLHRVAQYPVSIDDAGKVSGGGKWRFLSPYFGMGWNTEIAGGFYSTGDIGVMYQGEGKVHLSGSGLMTSVNNYQAAVQSAQHRIHHYMNYARPFYPVVMIGFGYRF